MRAATRPARRGAPASRPRSGLAHAPTSQVARSVAWRAEAARTRDRARDASRACCCSTSRWPGSGHAESAADDRRCSRALKGRGHHAAGRARHGRGVRAGRPHLGAGLRPRHRDRHAPTRSATTRRCASPISARETPDAERRAACRPPTAAARCCSTSTLEVGEGEVVTLLGRNGMGKTTTIRSIMGLTARRRPASIAFDGARHLRRDAGDDRAAAASASCRKAGRSFRR